MQRQKKIKRLIYLFILVTLLSPALPVTAKPEAAAPEAPTTTFIDVTISLEGSPDTATEQAPYENIIEYFADGVFEASNGIHKIRNVRIYRNTSAMATKGK